MTGHVIIYEGGTQALRTAARDSEGEAFVPSTANYRVVDLRRSDDSPDRVIVGFGPATIDTATTTTTAVAGMSTPDPSLLTVDDASAFVKGRRYLVSGAGRRELVKVAEVDGANRIICETEISKRFSVGATVAGVEIEGQFPGAEAADEQKLFGGGGPYAVDWYVNGAVEALREIIFVRRGGFQTLADESDVQTMDPQVVAITGRRNRIVLALRSAHIEYRARLQAALIRPECFYVSGEVGRQIVATLTLSLLWGHIDSEHGRGRMKEYRDRADDLFRDLKTGLPPDATIGFNPSTDTGARSTRVGGRFRPR